MKQFNRTGQHLPGQATMTSWQVPQNLSFEERIDWLKTLLNAPWHIGDLWCSFDEMEGDQRYGERVKLLRAGGIPGFDKRRFKTCAQYGWVARRVTCSNRLEHVGISFLHHMHVAALDPPDQRRWLERAVNEEWTAAQLRAAIRDWLRGISRASLQITAIENNLATILLVDPPWQYSNSGLGGAADEHYKTMSTDEICALMPAHAQSLQRRQSPSTPSWT